MPRPPQSPGGRTAPHLRVKFTHLYFCNRSPQRAQRTEGANKFNEEALAKLPRNVTPPEAGDQNTQKILVSCFSRNEGERLLQEALKIHYLISAVSARSVVNSNMMNGDIILEPQLFADYQVLYFAGAFCNRKKTGIPEVTLYRVFHHIAVTAMNLHGFGRHSLDYFGRKKLHH